MNPHLARRVPFIICGGVLGAIWLLRIACGWVSEQRAIDPDSRVSRSVLSEALSLIQRLELETCDSRMRLDSQHAGVLATNLGLVGLDVESLDYTRTNSGYGWPLPRYYHARVLEELREQGARMVLFDILFGDTNPECPVTLQRLPDGSWVGSDEYFARTIGIRPDVILSALPRPTENGLEFPAALFRKGAVATGIASRAREQGSVMRAIRPVVDTVLPEGGKVRIWHDGFILAACQFGLDLNGSRISRGRITLVDSNGLERIQVPVDSRTNFLIRWRIPENHEVTHYQNYADLLQAGERRQSGVTNQPAWQGRLVVVASVISGNNVSDMGATPLASNTPLSGAIMNVANSLMTGKFVRKPSLPADLALLSMLTLVPAALSWRLRTFWATLAVLVFAAAYIAVAVELYQRSGWMIPIVLPVLGALMMTHVALLTWRGVNELLSRAETQSFWRRVLSDNVFAEWEKQLEERAGGTHRRVTIVFADLRGFTDMVDESHRQVMLLTQDMTVNPEAARAFAREEADDSMATINRYLSEIARIFKEHDGTFDKYIGDCVMAFWGAPIPQRSHALACVLASIAAQRRLNELNEERTRENLRREGENTRRIASGEHALRMLPLLSFGVGIHTGDVTAGTLGGGAIVSSYTVFGRDANIASRLEAIAKGGQIVISHATWTDLQRDAPVLASHCRSLGKPPIKGIQESIEVFDVPWSDPAVPTEFNAPRV